MFFFENLQFQLTSECINYTQKTVTTALKALIKKYQLVISVDVLKERKILCQNLTTF